MNYFSSLESDQPPAFVSSTLECFWLGWEYFSFFRLGCFLTSGLTIEANLNLLRPTITKFTYRAISFFRNLRRGRDLRRPRWRQTLAGVNRVPAPDAGRSQQESLQGTWTQKISFEGTTIIHVRSD